MKRNKTIPYALILSAFFLYITAFSYAQSKRNDIENSTPSTTPVAQKGYYSIYNNAAKLNSAAGRLTFSNKVPPSPRSEVTSSAVRRKGYLSIGNNAEKKRQQMGREGIDFSNDRPARVLQSSTFPVITKGYYSIGFNAKKLQK